jgi:hypothetical protein
MPFCSSCGREVQAGAAYCGNCRTPTAIAPAQHLPQPQYYPPPVPQYPPQPPRYAAPKRSKWPLVLGILGAIFLLFVIGGALVVKIALDEHARQKAATIEAIHAVLNRDQELGDARAAAVRGIKVQSAADLDQIAAATEEYVQRAREIDTGTAPRDFAEAYGRNISAWADYAAAIKAHPHIPSDDEAAVMGLYKLFSGDSTAGMKQLSDELEAWKSDVQTKHDAIHTTWETVKSIASGYGA